MVNLTINGRPVVIEEGATIMKAADKAGIAIPRLCCFEGLNEIGACRICVVEVKGTDRLVAACSTHVEDGMVILTDSPRARRARKTNLELILSQHDCRCPTCVRNGFCALQSLSSDMNILDNTYKKMVDAQPWDMSLPLIRASGKCIKCMRCIQVCDNIQAMRVWELTGTGGRAKIGVRDGLSLDRSGCTYCGQCLTHCPTGALTVRDDTKAVFTALEDPEIITVVQVAPAVRSAWAEIFGVTREFATPRRMAAALRRLGFDYVFDTNFAADLTIMEEGSEFIERFTHKDSYRWPMFTSCCPGWVRFLKGEYPGYTDNLSTAKSPQQMFGAVTKSYFAQKLGVDPHRIFCVSVMPCTAKKSECALPTMHDACGDRDVDAVITTREFDRMLRAKGLIPAALPEEDFDSPLGTGTGAAVIFGATGGVMDAALRSAYYLITGRNPYPDAFIAVRGMDGWKDAVFNIPGAGEVRVAVASGLANTRKLMEAIESGAVEYDFVEIMACPGGCAGGGGQPIHDGKELADERGNLLWRLDAESRLRYSHENPEVLALYRDYFTAPLGEKSHHLLHTDHTGWVLEKGR